MGHYLVGTFYFSPFDMGVCLAVILLLFHNCTWWYVKKVDIFAFTGGATPKPRLRKLQRHLVLLVVVTKWDFQFVSLGRELSSACVRGTKYLVAE